jgi:glycosyltransferase involved in cell wall biosynthesis
MELMVLDDHSLDKSASIARKYTEKVFEVSGFLGAVRYQAAKLATRRWIVFIDSDVYVYPDWWEKVRKFLLDDEVGWVTGLCDFPSTLPICSEYHDYKFMKHGATAFSNTAVRRDLLLECEQVQSVHGGEDWMVKRYVMDRGLRAITLTEKLSYHDNEIVKGYFKAYFRWGQSYRLTHSPRLALETGIYSFLKAPLVDWLTFTRTKKVSLTLLFFLILVGFWGILGILCGMHSKPRST